MAWHRLGDMWTSEPNAGLLLIGPLGTNFSENLIEIYTFLFNKLHVKMPSGKRRPLRIGLNVSAVPVWCVHISMVQLGGYAHGLCSVVSVLCFKFKIVSYD